MVVCVHRSTMENTRTREFRTTMPQSNKSALTGAAAGLLGGLAASWIMSKFQSALKSVITTENRQPEQQEDPANVKAAAKIAESTGRSLTRSEKEAGGELLHYAVGGLSGAAYGAWAPGVPLPDLAAGAIFGTAVWAIADEIAVPALGFSKAPTEYPVSNHASALAAHLVYGISTALLCRKILKAFEARPVTIRRAAVTGAVSGLRSMTGPFFTLLSNHRSSRTTRLVGLLAVGELIADKLPKIPARIQPGPLGARALTGGLSGAAVFRSEDADAVAGAIIGAATAIGAAYAGYHLRHAAVEKGIPDFAYALGEDALAFSLGKAS